MSALAGRPRGKVQPLEALALWDARAVLRDRWFLAAAAAFALLTLAAAALALSAAPIAGLSSFDRVAATLIHLTMLFVPLLGLTVGAGWIAGERESGVLTMLLSQPLERRTLFSGKFLGVAWGVVSATVIGFGGAGAVLALRVGADRLPAFLGLIALSVLLAVASLAVGFLLSASSASRSRALGAALFVWLFFVVISDLGVLGSALILRLPTPAVLAVGIANPVSAFRVAAILLVSGSAELTGAVGMYAAERLGSGGLIVLLAGVLAIWTAASFLLGRRRFVGSIER